MSTVAPVTAVVGAIVPVSWGLIEGERPSALVLVGVGCALVAGALLAREEDGGPKVGGRGQLLVAGAAGAALGTSFIMFAKTSSDIRLLAGPLGPAGCGVLVGLVVLVLVLARPGSVTFPAGRDRRLALGAGGLDVLATTLLVIAVRRELAVVVAPVASLAPGMTVVLAWRVLHERIGRSQLVGLGVAGLGLILIASG